VGKVRTEINPIKLYRKKMCAIDMPLDVRVWLSILLSTGCRPAEASEYKYIGTDGWVVTLGLPIKKKRRLMSREIKVTPSSWDLELDAYRDCSGRLRSLKTYARWTKVVTGRNPRDYRHELSLYVLRKKNLIYVREMLCHSNVSTTQHYLDGEKADFLEIATL